MGSSKSFIGLSVGMNRTSRKQRKNGCSRNGRKSKMVGGVLTNQWTFDGSKVAGVNNYGQVNKVFTDCDYKAPAISVGAAGLPGFSVADAPTSLLSSLKFWGGKRKGKKTQRKTKKTQKAGGGGLAYGNTFEMQGPNPVTIQTRLGCESGAVGPMPPSTPAVDGGMLSKLKFWGGKKTQRKMKGGMSPLGSAFDVMPVRGSPYTLTPPGGLVYEAPKAGFSIEAPVGGNQAGLPPYEIRVGYDSKPVLSGPCMKGGKRKTSRKTKKRTHKRKH